MRKRPTGLLFLLLFCCCNNNLQTSAAEITDIQQNGFCFRLHDQRKAIDHYKRIGRPDLAEKVEKEAILYNKYVIQLFQDHFSFCPVYFFYAGQTDDLLARKPVLLNENLEPAPDIPLPEQVIVMDYNVQNTGESAFSTERFFILNSNIVVKPRTLTAQRVKIRGDSVAVVLAPIPLRSDKSKLLKADIQYLQAVLSGE